MTALNPNPYEPPRAAPDEPRHHSHTPDLKANTVPRSRALLTGYWLMFVASFASPITAVFVIPVFREVFKSFGTDLPFLTQAVLDYRLTLFAWPLIALVPAFLFSLDRVYAQGVHAIYKTGFVALLVAFVCSAFTVVLAMYLPIFTLGKVA